jgi:hypothetical protein
VGKISISIRDDLEEKLRTKAMKKFGMKKGCLSKAVEEAVESWLKKK